MWYMRRIGEEGLLKEAFRWNPPGRKKKGKPMKAWLYGVLEDKREKKSSRVPMGGQRRMEIKIMNIHKKSR